MSTFNLLKPKKTAKKSDRKRIISQLDRLYSEKVRDRDKVCRYCGKSKTTYTHHIFSRRHIGTRWDLDNGVALCVYCHRYIAHSDPERFRDWVISWMGGDRFNQLKIKAYYGSTKFTVTDLEWIRKELAA